MARTAYIALGSNLGDTSRTLLAALKRMDHAAGIHIVKVSTFIQSKPVGGPSGQDNYLNAVAQIETTLEPLELLAALQDIERALGRDRSREQRWGPRTCDLDSVLMEDVALDTPALTIPHPRMHQRAFVLQPLNEIAPQAMHPVLKKTVARLLSELVGPDKNN